MTATGMATGGGDDAAEETVAAVDDARCEPVVEGSSRDGLHRVDPDDVDGDGDAIGDRGNGGNGDSSVILHRIASYLSLGDAESMATSASASRTGGRRNRSSSIDTQRLPGHYSLDYHLNHSLRSGGGRNGRRARSPSTNTPGPGCSSAGNDSRAVAVVVVDREDEEDWFVGGQVHGSVGGGGCSSLPPGEHTPGLVALVPLEEEFQDDGPWTPAGQPTGEGEKEEPGDCTPHPSQHCCGDKHDNDCRSVDDDSPIVIYRRKRRRREEKRALQNKLAAAVFSHPRPLREYCLDAYATAIGLSAERQVRSSLEAGPSDAVIVSGAGGAAGTNTPGREIQQSYGVVYGEDGIYRADIILQVIGSRILDSVPLSVLLDFTESASDLTLETLLAAGHVGSLTLDACVSALCIAARSVAGFLSRMNPLRVLEFVLNCQRSAMGKTGDVLVSGIQSVATGVGSVSNAALNRLSRSGLALAGGVVGGSSRNGPSRAAGEGMGSGGFGRARKDASGVAGDDILESKLFHRLQKMESVSKLVAYSERMGEEAFSRHAKKRAQRMMHYNVSFRPFTATIQPGRSPTKKSGRAIKHNVSFELESGADVENRDDADDNDSVSSESLNGSIFMRTPTSFPPTPTSRLYYFERGSQFTENVVFLARDQLRVERGVADHNEQTRAMSKALIDGSRLAVFDAANIGSGIALSCGQHIATKVGNALYCSARSMIPVMRNSYVYFEISVSPSTSVNGPNTIPTRQAVDPTTLLVGLSTLEMPLDTLVGAWKGSVGLCSTGQILHLGRWLSSASEENDGTYGSNSTVGCLVYLDDNSAYTEGPNVTVDVTFNVNGRIVPSSACDIGGVMGDHNVSPSHSSQSQSAAGGDGCPEPTLSLVVPKVHELFPTVTLHSSGTSVMCRFSAEDLLANSRIEIGALSGVVVYAVDGSVVLDGNEEDEFLDVSCSSRSNEDFFHGKMLCGDASL